MAPDVYVEKANPLEYHAVFKNRVEANRVLSQLSLMSRNNIVVTLSDFLDLVGVSPTSDSETLGWSGESTAFQTVMLVGETSKYNKDQLVWRLILPPVKPLVVNDPKSGISSIVSPDAPTTTNEQGGSQSAIPVRFDLIDGNAMFEMAKVLHQGAEKYGADNWRKIPIEDHLNHLIMHAYAYLAGDRTDEHLSHIMCRAMFAQGVASVVKGVDDEQLSL